ncbi:hypothetical protein M3215_22775 [Bacillus cytotoxicus]|uniref:Uncharacterized protein n=1 Tax=Bacillus cytotoxicus TaxID=580165 RepID=A0ACC6AC66_9BACI|nr:hypothetical protein [Bacillus cytotoxicus]
MFVKYNKEDPLFFWVPLLAFSTIMFGFVKFVPFPSQDLLLAWYIAIVKIVAIFYCSISFMLQVYYKFLEKFHDFLCDRYGKVKGLTLLVLFSLFLAGGILLCLLILR